MLRYNHRLVERKWRTTWVQNGCDFDQGRVCTRLIASADHALTLENARLLVLADFFGSSLLGKKQGIAVFNAKPRWLKDTIALGLIAHGVEKQEKQYELGVRSRDFVSGFGDVPAREMLFCGRLLHAMPLSDLLPDFGGDALRIYFLFQGPPHRDYTFNWQGLVGAHRFVEQVWRLGRYCTGEGLDDGPEQDRLRDLISEVQARIVSKKPHTALAALMGFLKNKPALTKTEVNSLARLLQPFTPFISAELLDLVATIQDDD